MAEILRYDSKSELDTFELGKEIGQLIESGHIILLSGDLGAGKTLLVKGIGESLGLQKKEITSPSYTLVNEYQGQLALYHMDLYRLDTEAELYEIGFEEYLNREGVIVIEWPQLASDIIPPDFLHIKITVNNTNDEKRSFEIKAKGSNGNHLKEQLQERIDLKC